MKKTTIIIIIFLIVTGLAIGFLAFHKKESISVKSENKKEEKLTGKIIEIDCSHYGNYVDYTIGGINNPKIMIMTPVKCMILFNNHTGKDIVIKELNFDYEIEGDIENFEFEPTGLNISHEKTHVSLISNNGFLAEDGGGSIVASFGFNIKRVPKKDKLTIDIRNVKVISEEGIYFAPDYTTNYDIYVDGKYQYEVNKDTNEVLFYKNIDGDYQKINSYKCTGNCEVYAGQCFSYVNMEEGRMFLVDDNKAIFYDINKGVIGEYVTPIYALYDNSNNLHKQKYFVAKKTANGKSAIFDFNGEMIKDYIVDDFGTVSTCAITSNSYSISDNLITAKNDNKYGIIRITSNEVVVDYQFDDIRIYNNKYYRAKLDDKWYLYNFDNTKVIEDGYTEMFMPVDNILIVQEGEYLYIKDYTGKNIIDEKITVLAPYNENACCGGSMGMHVYNDASNQNIIYIVVDNGKEYNAGFEQYRYEYDIKNKTLTKKESLEM